MRDPVIASLEVLREDAKDRLTTAQGQILALTYGTSLLKRLDAQAMMAEEAANEVAIALVGRQKPVFGFVAWQLTIQPVIKRVVVHLRGSIERVALRGEVKEVA